MAAKKFELFMGYLGNGCTVCNKAVMEDGDYKRVCHISNAGNITWYVPINYVPGDALMDIENIADRLKANFKLATEREQVYNPAELYSRMLDALTCEELLEHTGKKLKGLDANINDLRPLYLKRM